jgi:hypothetical protein
MTVAFDVARELAAMDTRVLRTVLDLLDQSTGLAVDAAFDAEAEAVRGWRRSD